MNFEKKKDFANMTIEAAACASAKEGEKVEVAYSGGKDSDVLLYLARDVLGSDFAAIYKNTTIDPPGTMMHVLANGVEVRDPKMTFREIIEKKGFPSPFRRFCCAILKE